MSNSLSLVLIPKTLQEYQHKEQLYTSLLTITISSVYLSNGTIYRPTFSTDEKEHRNIENILFEKLYQISPNDPEQQSKIIAKYADLKYKVSINGKILNEPKDGVYDKDYLDYHYLIQHPHVAKSSEELNDPECNAKCLLRNSVIEENIDKNKIRQLLKAQRALTNYLDKKEFILQYLYRIYNNQPLQKLPTSEYLYKYFYDYLSVSSENVNKFLYDIKSDSQNEDEGKTTLELKVLILDCLSAGLLKQERDGIYFSDTYLGKDVTKVINKLQTDAGLFDSLNELITENKYAKNDYVRIKRPDKIKNDLANLKTDDNQ